MAQLCMVTLYTYTLKCLKRKQYFRIIIKIYAYDAINLMRSEAVNVVNELKYSMLSVIQQLAR